MSWLQIGHYASVLFIIIAFTVKVVRYAKMPLHLRWELYPLAGRIESSGRGSYLEEPEWRTKPRKGKSFFGEMNFMLKEILFFREYFRLNRSFWYLIYPFHIGIFLFAGYGGLLIVGALTIAGNVTVSADSANLWGRLLYHATLLTGGAGLVLSSLGGIGLLIKKIIDEDLKPYTRRIEYFNLLLTLAVFLTGLLSWVLYDHTFTVVRLYVKNLITFSPVANIEPLLIAHVILLLLTAMYLPFTNMMHFFAKWFTYHKVRWDDAPNLRGSKIERTVKELLNQPVSWSAPHIQSGKSWSEVATRLPEDTTQTERIK